MRTNSVKDQHSSGVATTNLKMPYFDMTKTRSNPNRSRDVLITKRKSNEQNEEEHSLSKNEIESMVNGHGESIVALEKIPGAPPLPTLSVFKNLPDNERAKYGNKYTNY